MFEFFLKRLRPSAKTRPADAKPRTPASRSPASREAAQSGRSPAGVTATLAPQPDAAALQQQALAKMTAIGDDEAALAAFIPACGQAQVRLQAAQKIHSRALLEQVLKAVRETDRRVAKLMQQRLDALALQERSARLAEGVLEQARTLVSAATLLPNQVVELDRAWRAIDAPPAPAQTQFSALHAVLASRLQEQALLQRRVLDAIAALRAVLAAPPPEAQLLAAAGSAAEQAAQHAEQHAELASLPRQLLPELASLRQQLQKLIEASAREAAAIAAREQALAQWEAAAAAPVARDVPEAVPQASLPVPELPRPAVEAMQSPSEAVQPSFAVAQPSFHEAQPSQVEPLPGRDTAQPDLDTAQPDLDTVQPDLDTAQAGLDTPEPDLNAPQSPAGAPPVRETRESMQARWRALEPVADAVCGEALQARFEAVLATLPAVSRPDAGAARKADRKAEQKPDWKQKSSPQSSPVQADNASAPTRQATATVEPAARRAQFDAALEGLQGALDEGALQKAVEHDRMLRQLDLDQRSLSAQQQTRLGAARAELTRLQGWAKWGGTVSREEMLAAVESLPQQDLSIGELAKKVGSMRERWREVDATAGPAPRAFWLRFDAACTAAYAPVAAHFAALSQQRAANAVAAQALLDEVAAFLQAGDLRAIGIAPDMATTPGAKPADWTAIAAFCQRMRQAWQRLGPLDRREQKRLDAAFALAMRPLHDLLETRQVVEVAQREQLIEEAAALAPLARDTPQRLQALQARWQQHAKSFPLARQPEQLLWQRFRAACDDCFAQRKAAGSAADAQRGADMQAREALCASLEQAAAADLTDAARATLLREARAQWDAAGPAPRAAQPALAQRFETALRLLETQQRASRDAKAQRQHAALLGKLQLCAVCEAACVAQAKTPSQAQAGTAAMSQTEAVGSRQTRGIVETQTEAVSWDASAATGAESIGGVDLSAQEGIGSQPLETATVLSARWRDAAPVHATLEPVLDQRFAHGLQARANADAAYAALLESNQAARDFALLQLEVATGIDSPAAFARQRLALQVQTLQSTLHAAGGRNAQAPGSAGKRALAQLAELLAIPATADALAQARTERLARAVLGASED